MIAATLEETAQFRAKCSRDTGFAARYLFEFNYDTAKGEDGTMVQVNRPNGGIRRDGPHAQMTEFIDADGSAKLMLAPRGSYKSSILESYCCRRVLQDRDTTILYVMKTEDMAKTKLRDMRRLLAMDRVVEVYGQALAPRGNMTEVFVEGRSGNVAHNSANIQACGVGQSFTGSHYGVIILDDVVDWESVRTAEQVEKTLYFFKMVIYLLDPGGVIIVNGTRYVDQDLYGHIIRNLERFQILSLDCGMQVKRDDAGKYYLEGEPVYPHLTRDHLQDFFDSMDNPADFVAQMCNSIMSSAEQLFRREHFQYIPRWEDWMGNCSGYILTDTAASTSKTACYSVAALVGLDYRDHAYLFDLRVGRMKPYEFVQHFVDMLDKWGSLINVHGCLFENIALNETYRAMITDECRRRGLNPNLISVPRGLGDDKKERRIEKLQGRFSNGRFHVVGTIPTSFNDLGKTIELWNAEGWRTEDDLFPKPDGELVKEFVFWPRYSKNDIADALADIDSVDRTGKRYCTPAAKSSFENALNRPPRGAGRPLCPVQMKVNGITRVVDIAVQPSTVPTASPQGSWWDQVGTQQRPTGSGVPLWPS